MSDKKYLVTEADLIDSTELCEHCVGNGEDCHGDYLCVAVAKILARHEHVERTCTFTLEPDREELAKREGMTAGEFATCDIPLGWTCSECGAQYRPHPGFPPEWMRYAPCCRAKVVSE